MKPIGGLQGDKALGVLFRLILAVLSSISATTSVFGQSSLADKGISLDLRHTSFYQGLASRIGNQGSISLGKFNPVDVYAY